MSEPIRNKKLDLPTAAPFVDVIVRVGGSHWLNKLELPRTLPPTMHLYLHMPSSLVSQASKKVFVNESDTTIAYLLPAANNSIEDLDRAAAASVFAQNPKLVSMIQGKLGSLVGRSSGYIESLPAPVRRRVAGLKGVQKEHSKLEAQFQEEVLELEKKYFAKFTPLYEKRAEIVNGTAEPTDAEIKAGEQDAEKEEDGDSIRSESPEGEQSVTDLKGIPEFWLSAMKNQISLAELITEKDQEALKYLTDIRMQYLEQPGFRLIFEFAENDFFSNRAITKTYYYQEESGYGGDFIYDHADGDKINWKSDKDLTVKIESKKQRNKSESVVTTFTNRTADTQKTPSKLAL